MPNAEDFLENFRKMKIDDNKAVEQERQHDFQITTDLVTTVRLSHKKLTEFIIAWNPESVLQEFYQAGFHNNLKYPDARVVRHISVSIVSDLNEYRESLYGDDHMNLPVTEALGLLNDPQKIKELRKRQNFKGMCQVCVTNIKWKFILWKEYQYHFDPEDILYGFEVELSPEGISVSKRPLIPSTPENFAKEIARQVDEVIRGKNKL